MNQVISLYKDKSGLFNLKHTILYELKRLPTHIHNHYEILYLLEGDISYSVEGHIYEMQPGDIVIMNNKELHTPVLLSENRYNRIVIEFHPSYLNGLQSSEYNLFKSFENRLPGNNNLLPADDVIKFNIKEMIQQIIELSCEKKPETSLLVKTAFANLLVEVNRVFEQKREINIARDSSSDKIIRIINYLNKLINSKEYYEINLDVLANSIYVNKHYLCHLFKKTTGFSIWDYILYKKIMKARDLLIFNNEMKITGICTECGFDDYSNFYRQFKKIVGMSPKEYRINNQNKKDMHKA